MVVEAHHVSATLMAIRRSIVMMEM